MAISISRLKTWLAKTNRCSVTTDIIITMADKVTEVVEVETKLTTVTEIARKILALLKVEAAEAEASIEVRITIEVEAAITTTTIMTTENREEGVTIAVIATNMVTIVVDASAVADITTEEVIITAEMVIHVVVIEIRMIVST